jgi:hypothetical protein
MIAMACHPSPCNPESVWRAAIAINNIGWSLLERECYDQAHLTLKDAALAMVALVYDGEPEARQSVEACLRAANQRLAFPHRSLPLAPLEREKFPEPLRLDVDEFIAIDASLEFVAIALHNSAVSYFFQSIAAAHTPDVQLILSSKSVSLLELSYSIISHVGGYAPSTFAHSLRILENLLTVMAGSGRDSRVGGGGVGCRADPRAQAGAISGRRQPKGAWAFALRSRRLIESTMVQGSLRDHFDDSNA